MLRADLHVHTLHSKVNRDIPFLRSRDCYSRPDDVYRTAKARGMDLVTITDHDSIDGWLDLLQRRPDATDVIPGEEVTCWLPGRRVEVHLGVYGTSEALHRELQPLRDNVFDVCAALAARQVFFALNHLLHFYDARVPLDEYLRLLEHVPAVEVRNGTMVPAHNRLVEQIVAGRQRGTDQGPLAVVAGSDAHTLRRVGRTWTEAPGGSREDFLDSLRQGLGRPGGCDGGAPAIAGDAYGVIARYVASLAGFGPRDHSPLERAAFIGFSAVSLPFEFLPLLIAQRAKAREARTVRAAAQQLKLPAQPAADRGVEPARSTV